MNRAKVTRLFIDVKVRKANKQISIMNIDSDKNTRNWSYHEEMALISVYEKRKGEYFECKKKFFFWESILADLEDLSVLECPTTVEQVRTKWKCLYRAYILVKDKGTKSGKFIYMKEMDAIFHDNPAVHKNNIVSVGVKRNPLPASESMVNTTESDSEELIDVFEIVEEPSGKENVPCEKKQKVTNSNDLLDTKRKYYAEKIKEKQRIRETLEKYLSDKEKAKAERHNDLIFLLTKNDWFKN